MTDTLRLSSTTFIVCAILSSCLDASPTRHVEAEYPALKTVEHLTDPRRVALWMEPFCKTDTSRMQFLPNGFILDGDTLTITPAGPVDIGYRRSDGHSETSFTVSIEPLVDKPRTTRFHLSMKGKGSAGFAGEAEASLRRIPEYLRNPERLYGFAIKEITVTDSVFLFSSRRIRKDSFSVESKALFDRLIASAEGLGARYDGVRIFHYDDSEPGIRSIYAGIGIDKPVDTNPDDEVKCKRMPFGHHLLAVDYEGPYRRMPEVLQAMDQYRSDKGKASMAIPFHKYLQEGYGFSDSQTVKMRVCYPVY